MARGLSGLLLAGVVGGRVDPDGVGQFRGLRGAVDEPLGVRGVGLGEHGAALLADLVGGAEVDGRGGVQSKAGVVVLVAVVVEEFFAERAGVVDVVEVVREGGAVLEGLERRFAERVVVAYVGPGVASG